MSMKLNSFCSFLLSSILIALASCTSPEKDNSAAIKEIKQTMQNYRQAWKAGDSALVLEKVSEDIILFLPGKSGKPVVNKKNVAEFWFPSSDLAYPILNYEIEHEAIEVSGNLAFYQGISKLHWCTVENNIGRDTTLSVSEFTTILKKEEEHWKIYRIMYNLKDQDYTR